MGRKKRLESLEQQGFRFHAREHESGNEPRMRMWIAGWAGDQFEVLSFREFQDFAKQLERFNIPVQIHRDSCDGYEDCKCPFFD